MSAPTPSHPRQHFPRQVRQTPEIDIKHVPDIAFPALLNRTEIADTGIVHQDVHATEGLFSGVYRAFDIL